MIVLYSRKDKKWKISDFGLSVPGSDREQTSLNARGTPSYRAPELLRGTKPTFTNKADIWAMGCIFYELVFQEKAFFDDWTLLNRAISSVLLTPSRELSGSLNSGSQYRHFVEVIISSMLSLEPSKRPAANRLQTSFSTASALGSKSSTIAQLVEILESNWKYGFID